MDIDIKAMRKGGNGFYFINKETSADSIRENNSKNSHRMADTARITKTETSKLKNVISASFKPLSLTIPIGDGFHESFHSSHCYL